MVYGLVDTQFINFPEGQSETRLRGLQNRLSINFLQFINRVEGALSSLNNGDSAYNLFAVDTTNDRITTRGQGDKVWHRSAEYTPGRPQRGMSRGGYLLPLYHYEIDMMMTDRVMQTITVEQFEDELATTIQAVARGRRADVLERLFDKNEVPLDDDGNGASPGFAGSGTGTNVFRGNLPNGQYTDASYTHYLDAANTDAAITAMISTARDRMDNWQQGPYDLYGSKVFLDRLRAIAPHGVYTADDLFVDNSSSLIRPGTAQTEALVDPATYQGVFLGNIRVRYHDLTIDGNNAVMFKVGTKPLVWRYDPIWGRNAYVDDRRLMPLTEAAIMQSYGIGVGNRTGAAVMSVAGAGAVYQAPRIWR